MPKISIIIPVYNSEKYLEKCLDSIFNQSFDDFEVIIVNDGSTDSSQTIIDAYKGQHSDILTALWQENAGQGAARNRGLSAARGEFIFFVDSDDYLRSDALEAAYSYASANRLDIVCFNLYEVRDAEVKEFNYRIFHSGSPVQKYLLNEASPCNKLIRRELFVDNGLRFSEGLIYEDLELIPQLALYTDKIGFLDERLYYYVIHDSSTMHQKAYSPKLACIYTVMESLKEKFSTTEYTQELEFIFIAHLLHYAVLRYLPFPEGKGDMEKISHIMRKYFPKWYKNVYYRSKGIKYKIVCTLAYFRQRRLLKFLLKL